MGFQYQILRFWGHTCKIICIDQSFHTDPSFFRFPFWRLIFISALVWKKWYHVTINTSYILPRSCEKRLQTIHAKLIYLIFLFRIGCIKAVYQHSYFHSQHQKYFYDRQYQIEGRIQLQRDAGTPGDEKRVRGEANFRRRAHASVLSYNNDSNLGSQSFFPQTFLKFKYFETTFPAFWEHSLSKI